MRQTKFVLAMLAAASLAACGGGGSNPGEQSLKTKYSSEVIFGDSLSDSGSYAVGGVAAAGGGKFTVNGTSTTYPALTGKIWTELVASQLGLPAPCPAQTGLKGQGPFAVAVVNHSGCYSYAQGGSRVTNPIGPHNAAVDPVIGQLTVPVVTQVANHLAAVGGKFSGTELVTVMAGGNDALALTAQLQAAATAAGTAAGAQAGQVAFGTSLTQQMVALVPAANQQAAAVAIGTAIQTTAAQGGDATAIIQAAIGAAIQSGASPTLATPAVYGPIVAKAQSDATAAGQAAGAKAGADYAAANGPKMVQAMAQAGAELAALVETQIVGKGANFVVVNNLPDVSVSPAAVAGGASAVALAKAMSQAFNAALKAGVAADAKVLYVDLFTLSDDQSVNPGPYGLTNTTTPACSSTVSGGYSLFCTVNSTITGDVSHYMFADTVHPTPFEHSLIAKYVVEQMIVKGWL
ncbi:MAG: SGNH/GDSL hydrolase family protein [Telluria sp.]